MKSVIYHCNVWHKRPEPQVHEFAYGLYYAGLDLDELPELDAGHNLLRHNRWGCLRIRDAAYGPSGPGSLRDKLTQFFQSEGVSPALDRVVLLTVPEYWGYAFNPVSFYCCYDKEDRLTCAVAEVHNTFAEVHMYPLLPETPTAGPATFHFDKDFYVSPFMGYQNQYELSILADSKTLNVVIHVNNDGHRLFSAGVQGTGILMDADGWRKTLWKYPFAAWRTVPRIHWQAFRLYFQRKARVFHRAQATSKRTVRTHAEGIVERLRTRILSHGRKGIEAPVISPKAPER